MPNTAAWVTQAMRRYHAGEITLEELQRLVDEHRHRVSRENESPGR